MPDPVTVSFKPRYNECDPDGQLHTASYVRFMLQAAIEAGAAADMGTPGLEAAFWLERVGDIGLRIIQPAMFGDALEVQSRLASQGPPAWRREFSFSRGGVLLAAGFVDVFEEDEESDDEGDQSGDEADDTADQETDQEAAPANNGGAVGETAWDGPVGDPPVPPRRAFHSVWRAGWPYLDISGQLDPAGLTQMLNDVERRAAEALGWTAQRDQDSGIAWQVSEHRLELFDPIQSGQVLKVASYIGASGDDWMDRHASLVLDESGGVANEVAHARTRWTCLSTATGQPGPIPDDWLYDMADQMVDE